MTTTVRVCEWCSNGFDGRSDALYCSRNHKRAASRARKNLRERVTANPGLSPSESLTPVQREREINRLADARFHALLNDVQTGPSDERQREWAVYTRRHGTISPDEQSHRLRQGRQARADDWAQGTQRFAKPVMTLAEQARQARGAAAPARTPVTRSGPPAWDDDIDPAAYEPAATLDGVFRRR